MIPNPTPAPNVLGWLVLGGFAVAVGYALFAPKPAQAALNSTSPGCPIVEEKIDAWGKARKFHVIWLFTDTAPPATWAILYDQWLKVEWPEGGPTTTNTVVITQANGKFWSYNAAGQPSEDPAVRADYCAFN